MDENIFGCLVPAQIERSSEAIRSVRIDQRVAMIIESSDDREMIDIIFQDMCD